ncbi:hypothetical protein [Yinghuangia soli]|uniref:Uncharacterized protein n=1 Tax=Yinghuangia soli TaxID=2908204 RepID=A0AA41U1G9_9ACTN|nr:hypothetical protein [Yinghuangia soli]MCF2529530.1 hypothetical protein [Yinghuangia soli]
MSQTHNTPVHQIDPWRRTRRFGPGLSVLAWSLLLPIAVAWKVGVQDDPAAAAYDLPRRYVFEPLVAGATDAILGLAGTALFVGASVAILILALRGWFDGRLWFVMVGAAAVGIPVGWAYRVTTAAYIDSGIGGPFVAFGVIVWAALVLPFVVLGALAVLEDPDPVD